MNGEYSMDHYGGMYDGNEYHHDINQKDSSPLLMLFIILFCSLSLNLFRCCSSEQQEEPPINQPLLLEKKEITDDTLFNETCSICLEQFQKTEKIVILDCNHIFHFQCMSLWIKNNNTCPLCRDSLIHII